MKSAYIELPSRNLRMHYRDSQGSEPPLLLLHGGWATGRMNWGRHYESLSRHFRVISPDHRAHGRTNDPEGRFVETYKDHAHDIAAFIEALGLERPTIMGHSSGGLISLHLSVFYPQLVGRQILIGIHPNIGRSAKFFQGMQELFFAETPTTPPSKWRYMWNAPTSALYLWWVHKQTDWYDLLCKAWPMWIKELVLARCDNEGVCDYARISCPTLVVWGSRDEFGTYEDFDLLQKWIPGSRKGCIEGADHLFVINEPHLLQKVVWPFLMETTA